MGEQKKERLLEVEEETAKIESVRKKINIINIIIFEIQRGREGREGRRQTL